MTRRPMTKGLFILPVGGSLREYEEHGQSIVVSVLKAAGDAAVEFDESVDRFGAAVAGAGGVDVENDRVGRDESPLSDRF